MYINSGGVREYIVIPDKRQRYDFFNLITYWFLHSASSNYHGCKTTFCLSSKNMHYIGTQSWFLDNHGTQSTELVWKQGIITNDQLQCQKIHGKLSLMPVNVSSSSSQILILALSSCLSFSSLLSAAAVSSLQCQH